MASITINDEYGRAPLTVDLDPRWEREHGLDRGPTRDLCLEAWVSLRVPLLVTISLRSDGTWRHIGSTFRQGDNRYFHFAFDDPHDRQSRLHPTEAQRRTLARWFLRLEPSPFGLALGGPVKVWAFDGLAPDDVSARYGNGHAIVLTAPCGPDEAILR
jgi:hypothetical protein